MWSGRAERTQKIFVFFSSFLLTFVWNGSIIYT
nr:MAG TPA: agnoprotein [Caudoviricetes sp.]